MRYFSSCLSAFLNFFKIYGSFHTHMLTTFKKHWVQMPVGKFYSANNIMYLLMILLLILLLSNQVLLSNSRLFLFGGAPGSFISWRNHFYGIFLCWKAFPRKFTFPQLYTHCFSPTQDSFLGKDKNCFLSGC